MTTSRLAALKSARSTSLTLRVFLGTAVVVIAVVIAAFASVTISARHDAEEATRRGLEQSADLVAQFLAGRERTLMGGVRVFVQGPYFRTLVAERRKDDVLDQASEAAQQVGADWVFITDENGVVLAKSDEPGISGISMGQFPLVANALSGHVTSGFGASGDTALFQVVAVPIIAKLGAPVGVLVATRLIDTLFVRDVKAATASDLLFYSRDAQGLLHAAAATVKTKTATASLAKLISDTAFSLNIRRVNGATPHMRIGDADYFVKGTSLNTSGGESVGGFLVLRPDIANLNALAGIRKPLLVAMTVGFIVALVAAWIAARFVTRPVRALSAVVARASEGELVNASLHRASANGVREIQELAQSFESLMAELRDKEALINVAHRADGASIAQQLQQDETAPKRSSRVVGLRSSTGAQATPQLQLGRPGLMLQMGAVLANRYVIEAEVGRGGLGIVYRARDRVLAETIAIKMLRPETIAADPTAFERLKSELRVTRRISHRNVVRTYDLGETNDTPFLTMEYVDGASLFTIIQARGPLSVPSVIAIGKQLLRALAVAHEHGIVHGDLKPQNLLVNASGLLKITDFGVARLMRDVRSNNSAENSARDRRLSGAVLGTPEYMAPEQLIGEPASALTDIYAAGAVLQECLSGTTPYNADTPIAFVARKMAMTEAGSHLSALRALNENTNQELLGIIESMIDPRAESRASSARQLLGRFVGME